LRSRQRVEQNFRLLQVGGVETLGEPSVDRREQIVRLLQVALLGPEPR
jgi:hypothetical protein